MTNPKVAAAYDKIRIDANSAVRIWKNVLAIQAAFDAAMNGKPIEQPKTEAAEEKHSAIYEFEKDSDSFAEEPEEEKPAEEERGAFYEFERDSDSFVEEAEKNEIPTETEIETIKEPEASAEDDIRVYEVPVKTEERSGDFDWSELEAETEEAEPDEEQTPDEEMPDVFAQEEEHHAPSHARHSRHSRKQGGHRSTVASVCIGAVIMIVAAFLLFFIFRGKDEKANATQTTAPQVNSEISVAIETPTPIAFEGPKKAVDKLSNVQKAMQEWSEYKAEKEHDYLAKNLPSFVNFIPNDIYFDGVELSENGDGTVSLIHWRYVEDMDNIIVSPITGRKEPALIQKYDYEHSVTVEQEEYEAYNTYMAAKANAGSYGDYNYSYAAFSADDAEKLESIASKHKLTLRKGDGITRGFAEASDSELLADLASRVGHGDIYAGTPEVDYFTCYENGAFEAMAEIKLNDGRRMYTLTCSAPYTEMIDVMAANGITLQGDTMEKRDYTTADGTEVTIAQNDDQAIIYAYLEDSYVVVDMSINAWRESPDAADTEEQSAAKQETDFELTEEAVNYVADFIKFSNIGK